LTSSPRRHFSRLGLCFAAGYALIAVIIYWLIASSPEQDPLKWILFIWLGWPWYLLADYHGLSNQFYLACALLNFGTSYLLGWSVQKMLRRIFSNKQKTSPDSAE